MLLQTFRDMDLGRNTPLALLIILHRRSKKSSRPNLKKRQTVRVALLSMTFLGHSRVTGLSEMHHPHDPQIGVNYFISDQAIDLRMFPLFPSAELLCRSQRNGYLKQHPPEAQTENLKTSILVPSIAMTTTATMNIRISREVL